MKRVVVGVHVQRIDGQVVRGQIQRMEHFTQRQKSSVAMDDDFIGWKPAQKRDQKGYKGTKETGAGGGWWISTNNTQPQQ